MPLRGTANDELETIRREARFMVQRRRIAVALIENALATHGSSRHPLVDVLLDVRNALNRHEL